MEDGKKAIVVNELKPSFREEITSQPGGENIKRCFACGTCVAGCPITEVDEEFNCRRIVHQILLGMREEVLSSPAIWLCLECYRCYARCPQKVNFTDIMRILRYLAIKGNYMPPQTLEQVEDLDRFIQEIRCSFIKHTFKPDEKIAKEIKSKIDQKLNIIKSYHLERNKPQSSLIVHSSSIKTTSNELRQTEDSGL
ncbi:MAG: 4Fe-4S dicluster domain-containing protein [Actinobacteria bacterium]|nr:4Fe-4S dicluster domain-containing protein [Actinomycetota bacterium]MBL7123334.1 4Fe-4S dicluster domain-containing protein [Actinomycetota bacterium]